MIDILLLAGVALCALSVLTAIVSVVRTRAPRGAAILLVLGLVLAFAGSWLDQRPFGVAALKESWQRLLRGEVSLGSDPVTAPAPTPTPTPEPTPAAATPEAPATPATEAPGAEPPDPADAIPSEATGTDAAGTEAGTEAGTAPVETEAGTEAPGPEAEKPIQGNADGASAEPAAPVAENPTGAQPSQ
ncbi:hypothetical protein [Paracoccus sp. TOH]|uniref:hypothetical protein n=1 Tax=Paracoccus sp. TOH TaxID=1263728 RepID=UPI0025B0332B|nr:hypothetical protein [Paracoccus sp. TOH]WJS83238.1 hypothetical protein NBE95_05450 [Paracoccus sp. TOH]